MSADRLRASLDRDMAVSLTPDQNAASAVLEETVIPLHSEDIAISRRLLERTVRVHVNTVDHERLIDEAMVQERVEIERIAIGRPVDAVPPIREEGTTTVIPVVEEVLVVERRLILKEEIHLHRVQTTERHQETVTLREQQAVVERSDWTHTSPTL